MTSVMGQSRAFGERLGLVRRRPREWWPEDGPLVPLRAYDRYALALPVAAVVGLVVLIALGVLHHPGAAGQRPWVTPAMWLTITLLVLWRRPGWFSGGEATKEHYDDVVEAREAPRAERPGSPGLRPFVGLLLAGALLTAALGPAWQHAAAGVLAVFVQSAAVLRIQRAWERERGRVLLVSRDRPFSGDVWSVPDGDAAARR